MTNEQIYKIKQLIRKLHYIAGHRLFGYCPSSEYRGNGVFCGDRKDCSHCWSEYLRYTDETYETRKAAIEADIAKWVRINND